MRTVDHPNFMQELGADTVMPVRATGGKKIERDELTRHLNAYLDVRSFKDAAYNGLQVSGRGMVSHVAVGVTANKALIEAAVIVGADTILGRHPSRRVRDAPISCRHRQLPPLRSGPCLQ